MSISWISEPHILLKSVRKDVQVKDFKTFINIHLQNIIIDTHHTTSSDLFT